MSKLEDKHIPKQHKMKLVVPIVFNCTYRADNTAKEGIRLLFIESINEHLKKYKDSITGQGTAYMMPKEKAQKKGFTDEIVTYSFIAKEVDPKSRESIC